LAARDFSFALRGTSRTRGLERGAGIGVGSAAFSAAGLTAGGAYGFFGFFFIEQANGKGAKSPPHTAKKGRRRQRQPPTSFPPGPRFPGEGG